MFWRITKIIFLLSLLTACSPHPVRIDNVAEGFGFKRKIYTGKSFKHVVYSNTNFADLSAGQTIHIYLEGDGTPWIKRIFPATDPTPRSPLMLKLMAQDKTPSVYLGRPCYHGFYSSEQCDASLWTSHRYSSQVISTMAQVIKQLSRQNQTVVLLGHSGGGAIAMLLAEEVHNIDTIVTVAGNLDTDAWTKHHGYSRLSGSLNPARQKLLRSGIQQIHLIGGKDKNIPAEIIQNAIATQNNKEVIVYEDFNHSCCWQKAWTDILKKVP